MSGRRRDEPAVDLDQLAQALAGRPDALLRDAAADSLQRTVHDLLARVHLLEQQAATPASPPAPEPATAAVVEALLAALWASNAPLTDHPLVSVVTPTFLPARLALLRSAIDSVRSQTYSNWELLVVDNSTEEMLTPLPDWWPDDHRIRVLRSAPRRGNLARSTALAQAHGSVIAYLDDDCTLFPWWLRAAVVALGNHPEAPGCYGIRLSEGPGVLPWNVEFARPDGLRLHRGNNVDTNTLAHRAVPGLTWDPDLAACGDYDLVTNLGLDDLIPVPVPACAYGVRGAQRVWSTTKHDHYESVTEVRRRARVRRPLRVLGFNSMYPLLSETYIGDELEALRLAGAEVVLGRHAPGPTPCPSRVDAPLYESLTDALAAFEPDVVLYHWAHLALGARKELAAHGIPYAVRMHSFDAPFDDAELFDPWCVGVWDFPDTPREHPLVHHLPCLVLGDHPTVFGPRNGRALSVSAGLPKKGWGVLAEAAAAAGMPLDVVIARTVGYENEPDRAGEQLRAQGHADGLHVDVPYDDVQAMLRRAGVFVYSVLPGVAIGQPRSVIEAALAGTPMVLPDHPRLRSLVHDAAHWYQPGDVASLAGALDEAAHHPLGESHRRDTADRVRAVHCDPSWHQRFAAELAEAVVAWRDRQPDDLSAIRSVWRRSGGRQV